MPTLPALTLPSANAAADFMSSEGAENKDNIITCRLACLLKSLYKIIAIDCSVSTPQTVNYISKNWFIHFTSDFS